jgi:glutaredoxin
MKPVTLFYLARCPFCKRALKYLDELKEQEAYRDIEVKMIEESEEAELADRFDYYYVPTFYIDGEKLHEGGITKAELEAILKKALEE